MELALITGANRGIGLELSRQLLERGVGVIAACRSSSPELDSSGAEVRQRNTSRPVLLFVLLGPSLAPPKPTPAVLEG